MTYKQRFIAALFLTAKNWNQPKYPSPGEWMCKLQYVHKGEYYSALRRNRVLGPTATGMNHRGIMLWNKPDTDYLQHMILFIWHSRKGKTIKTKSRSVVSWDGCVEGSSLLLGDTELWEGGESKLDCGNDKIVYVFVIQLSTKEN